MHGNPVGGPRSLQRRLLDRGRLRWVLGWIESAHVSRERTERVRFRPRGRWWILEQGGVAMAYADFDGPPPRAYERVVLDSFCHGYVPAAGDVVVDIGAGIGDGAITFSALVGARGRVCCVEAHPATFDRLAIAVDLNRLENVDIAQLAVTDRRGEARISDEPAASYFAGTVLPVPEGSSVASSRALTVPADTLDGVYRRFGLDRVDLLKVNIEGAEALAAAGWDEALERTANVAISCHDFVLSMVGDAPQGFATFELVRAAVENAGFAVETRPDDAKPWNRYYVYGAKHRD